MAKLNEEVFHVDDLAALWQIKDKNTLHTTLKRYNQQKLLFRIYRGLYSIKPINKVNPFLLGVKALHAYAYISAETVISISGIITQDIRSITLISNKSKRFNIGEYDFYSRKLSERFLYNPAGIEIVNGVKTASLERAIADLLYYNPKYFFDADSNISWKKVKAIQAEVGYPIRTK